jgi:endonuclease/exonuclease/phosphatase family metal-dependent hydrolase
VLINTHNEAFDDGSQRREQMAVLRETMIREYLKGNYVITGGDWNLNPLGFDPGTLRTGDMGRSVEPRIDPDFLPEGWQWAYDPEVPTNRNVDQIYQRGKTPVTIIDFFVISPNVTLLEIKTEDLGFQWADHQPVRMKIRLQ